MPTLPKITVDARGVPHYRCGSSQKSITKGYGIPLLNPSENASLIHPYWGFRENCYANAALAAYAVVSQLDPENPDSNTLVDKKIKAIKKDLGLADSEQLPVASATGPNDELIYSEEDQAILDRAPLQRASDDYLWRSRNKKEGEKRNQAGLHLYGYNKANKQAWYVPVNGSIPEQKLIGLKNVTVTENSVLIEEGDIAYELVAKKDKDTPVNSFAHVDAAGIFTDVGVKDKKKRKALDLEKRRNKVPKVSLDEIKGQLKQL